MLTLTDEVIAKFEPDGKKWIVFFDREMPCLGVRVYPGGSKSFIFRYRMLGQKHLVVIDPCWKITIPEARAKALEMRKKIDEETDLAKERARQKVDDRKLISFLDFCKLYMEQYAIPHKKSWKEDQRRIDLYLLPLWKDKYLSEIGPPEVAALHKQIGSKHPYQANRVLELISTMFKLAKDLGFDAQQVSSRALRPYREYSRERWIKPAEMDRLAVAIESESDHFVRTAIQLYLLTGLRKQELLKLKWTNIDFDSCELRIDGKLTKNGKSHTEPLSMKSVELIQSLPKVGNNPYLFPGREQSKGPLCKYSETKCRNTIDKAWDRIRTEAGLDDVQIHDLRRTTGAWLAQAGHSLHMVGQVLNQSNERTTQVYARLDNTHARAALEDLSTKLNGHFSRNTAEPKIDVSIYEFVQSLHRTESH